MRRFVTGLLVLVSAITLLLASTSLWTRRNVINTQVFVSNVETIVDLPAVEARINDRVTTTVMSNPDVQDAIDAAVSVLPPRLQQFRPTVENGIRSLISAGVARLLTNDPFRPLTQAALISAHNQLVAGQPVRFTLGQAKELVPESAQDGIAGQVLALLPDDVGVTLLTPADAPQVYNALDLLKSAWWWLGLIAIATLIGALAVSRRRRGTLRAWAVTSTVVLLLLLITLRVLRGRVVAAAKPEGRDALGAIYDVLAGSLRSWTLWLVLIVLVVLVGTLIWGRLGLVAGVRRGIAAARAQVRRRREEHELAPTEGAEGSAPVAVAEESWPRRVAADTRAFVAGMDLDRRAAAFGAFVEAHLRPARWAGIVLGVVVLLTWPSPTLSVLIWIAALVALYVGALEWLRSKAPAAEAAEAEAEAVAEAAERAVDVADAAPVAVEPVAVEHVAVQIPRPADGHPLERVPAVEPLVPAALTPEAISTLNDRLDLLVRLGAARDAGVLTEQEFSHEKERLLGV